MKNDTPAREDVIARLKRLPPLAQQKERRMAAMVVLGSAVLGVIGAACTLTILLWREAMQGISRWFDRIAESVR